MGKEAAGEGYGYDEDGCGGITNGDDSFARGGRQGKTP